MGYEVIKELAKERGITLVQIADNAGISYNSLSKIIRNTVSEPKYSTMQSIAQSLCMNTDELAALVGIADSQNSLSDINALEPDALRIGHLYQLADESIRNTVSFALEQFADRLDRRQAARAVADDIMIVYRAAKSVDDRPGEVVVVPKSYIQKLKDAPKRKRLQ